MKNKQLIDFGSGEFYQTRVLGPANCRGITKDEFIRHCVIYTLENEKV